MKLRTSSPAPTSSMNEIATCATISALRAPSRRLPTVRWPASLTDASVPPRERRQQAEQQAGEDRHAEREGQHRAVDRDLPGARREAGGEGDQQIADEPADQEAERAAGDREQRALGQQLAGDAAAAGAERAAQRQLALAPDDPRQREVGDVRGTPAAGRIRSWRAARAASAAPAASARRAPRAPTP